IAGDVAPANNPRSFVIEKEKQAVPQDGASEITAKLIVTQHRFGKARTVGEKGVRIQPVIAKEFEQRAVEGVRAGLSGYVNGSSCAAAVFGGERVAARLELFNCFHADGVNDRSAAAHGGTTGAIAFAE